MNVLIAAGTRPEAIKVAPVIIALKKRFKVFVLNTAQHREMVDSVFSLFDIKPDIDLNIMKENQSLYDITVNVFSKMQEVLRKVKPDVVMVQGDTTTAMAIALSAFYEKLKLIHIEAGLRSFDKYNPYPEEINRKIISLLADIHFAPTQTAKENLEKEGIVHNVEIIGNTGIDALVMILNKTCDDHIVAPSIDKVLITLHRRESIGTPMELICKAIKNTAWELRDTHFTFPVHLNPKVREIVNPLLGNIGNISLIDPLPYDRFAWELNYSKCVITDSGGVQEEAAFLGTPCLVMRMVTERTEGIEQDMAKLLYSEDVSEMTTNIVDFINNAKQLEPSRIYGDGKASQRILDYCLGHYSELVKI